MPLSPDDPAVLWRRVSMLFLVGAHLLIGLVLGVFVDLGRGPNLPSASFGGLVFAQASLLGIWAGLGAGPWWRRLIGLVVGSGCLGVEVGIGLRYLDGQTFCLFTFMAIAVALIHAVFRHFRFRIGLPTTEYNAKTEIQFGIRHLLILTVLVSVMLALGRKMTFNLFDSDVLLDLFIIVVFSSPYVLIGVLSPWAVLGKRHLVVRGVVFLVVAAAIGWGIEQVGITGPNVGFVLALSEAVLLIVSLLVVRFCGYRLVRRCKMRVGQEHP